MTTNTRYLLKEIRRRHSDEFTLAIDHFEITAGETVCLVGPTGAGKTTLLRLLTGVDRVDQGCLQYDEISWAQGVGNRDAIRSIALVPQRPIVLARSVRENVAYGLRLRGIDPQERVDAALEQLGLEQLASRPAQALSGGQTQLVALARALVLEPRVLLLDEPTANLDPGSVGRIETVLNQLRADRHTTIVWATHNLGQVQRIADRVCLLLQGEIVESAPVDKFFRGPRDPRTASFTQGRMVY